MNRRLLVSLTFAGVALGSGVASANSEYWRDNGLLLEVSADPRDGRDFVQVDSTRADSLELRALNSAVMLRGITLRFSDGRAMSQRLGAVRPGQPVMVDLPSNCGAITGVELDYGDPADRRRDRTTARLQIVPHNNRAYQPHVSTYQVTPVYPPAYQPAYQPAYPPAPVYQPQPGYQTRPAYQYQVQPRPRRVRSSWQIRASVRF